jgi:hypothetical protein
LSSSESEFYIEFYIFGLELDSEPSSGVDSESLAKFDSSRTLRAWAAALIAGFVLM